MLLCRLGGIHPADLTRIQDSDDWLRRFLLHNDRDIKESLTMAWDTCKWRKTFGTNGELLCVHRYRWLR